MADSWLQQGKWDQPWFLDRGLGFATFDVLIPTTTNPGVWSLYAATNPLYIFGMFLTSTVTFTWNLGFRTGDNTTVPSSFNRGIRTGVLSNLTSTYRAGVVGSLGVTLLWQLSLAATTWFDALRGNPIKVLAGYSLVVETNAVAGSATVVMFGVEMG